MARNNKTIEIVFFVLFTEFHLKLRWMNHSQHLITPPTTNNQVLLLLYYTTNPIILGVLHLYHSNLVCNIKGIIIWLKTNKCLFQTIWSDQSIHLFRLNVIQAGHSVLDLLFVGTSVNNKYKCVVILNLLHSRLCGERVLDNSKGIQLLELWCTAACIEARMRYMASFEFRNQEKEYHT